MKKKMVLRLLSLAMVASMTGTMLPSNLQIVSAEESVATEEKAEKAEETAVLEDGINDAWTQENRKRAGRSVTEKYPEIICGRKNF